MLTLNLLLESYIKTKTESFDKSKITLVRNSKGTYPVSKFLELWATSVKK